MQDRISGIQRFAPGYNDLSLCELITSMLQLAGQPVKRGFVHLGASALSNAAGAPDIILPTDFMEPNSPIDLEEPTLPPSL